MSEADPRHDLRQIVTIDGPAGAGKSTVARCLAERLGYAFLDTGAMYRAVAWAALDRGLPVDDGEALGALARQLQVVNHDQRWYCDQRDVTEVIRSPDVTQVVSQVASHPSVRAALVPLQRQFASQQPTVSEGRDQGTIVFPHASHKVFLTASPEERARRRALELKGQGVEVDEAQVLRQQQTRDAGDQQRAVGPLQPASDAIYMLTDGLDVDEIVTRLQGWIQGGAAPVPSEPTQNG